MTRRSFPAARGLVLVLAAVLVQIQPAQAAMQSLRSIHARARAFLTTQVAPTPGRTIIAVAAPDPRLRLRACGRPLQAFLAPGSRPTGRLAVGVRCKGPSPWTVYLSAHVRSIRAVVVAARPLATGTTLTAADLAMRKRDVNDLFNGYFVSIAQVLGKVVRNGQASGAVLNDYSVSSPTVIHRGDLVVLTARLGGMVVRSEGHALGDGARGALIKVRNDRSRRVVEGQVIGPGRVRVSL